MPAIRTPCATPQLSARSIGNASPAQARADVHSCEGGRPELDPARWESEGEKRRRAEIQTACRNIRLSNGRLVTTESDAEPSVGVEGARRFQRTPDDGGKRASDLRGRDALLGASRRNAIWASR